MKVFCALPNGLTCGLVLIDEKAGTVEDRSFTLVAGPNNVPDDLWAAWYAENATYGPVVSGHIHAAPDEEPKKAAKAKDAPAPAEEPEPAEEKEASE